MTAELRRGLILAGIGVAGGLAVVAVLFGSGDLLNRARGLVAPGEPRRAAELPPGPGKADAEAPAPKGDKGGARPDGKPGDLAAIDPNAAPDRTPQADSKAAPGGGAAEDMDKGKAGPSLDIVRVEPSGEAVLAGRGAPKAKVELLRDDKPIASAEADASGQFALVPPALPPGNSALSLRTTAPDGTVTQGRESVVVVVAPDKATKPLVAVSEPDKATRVLSQPEAPQSEAKQPAKVAEDGRETGKEAGKKPEAVPGQQAASETGKGAAPKPEAGKSEIGKPGEKAVPQREAALPGAGTQGQRPGQGSGPGSSSAAGEGPPVKIVSVDAQEGGRLFVAGQATAWTALRLYLNDTLVASGRSGADGRIAFTIGRGVKPGGYQIRIDQVDGDTGKVRNRAQVAFAFPVQLAAKDATDKDTPAKALPAKEAKAPAAGTPPGPPQAGPGPAGDGKPGETARTAAGAEPASKGGAASGAADTPGPGPKPVAEAPASAAPPASSPLAPLPAPQAPARIAEAPPPLPEPAGKPGEQAGTVFVPEIATAKIVRGDNLWTISHRTYGNGTRYTVIYDANREQIRDPNLIYPGQIFVLPKDTKEAPPAADRQGARRG